MNLDRLRTFRVLSETLRFRGTAGEAAPLAIGRLVYRLWRDLGYAIGALLAGVVADLVGVGDHGVVGHRRRGPHA